MKKFISLLVLLGLLKPALAQMTGSDSLFVIRLQNLCSLNVQQTAAVDTLLKTTTLQLKQLDKELSKVSRSDISDQEKSNRQSALRQQRKELIEGRDMAIGFLLDDRQRKIYFEQVKPSKPAVLHMGMNHDRASCNVCVVK